MVSWCKEATNQISSAYSQQVMIQDEITRTQINMVVDKTKDVYKTSVEFNTTAALTNYHVTLEQINLIKSFAESDSFETINSTRRMVTGGYSIGTGVALILAPVPTPADDLIGVRKVTFGIINFFRGFAEFLGEVLKK